MPAIPNFPLATWGAASFQELGAANVPLGNNDCHFGISGTASAFNKRSDYGPRGIDIENRGGIIAETLWQQFQRAPGTWSNELSRYLGEFWDFCSNSPINEAKITFPHGAMMDGEDIGGSPKYRPAPEYTSFPGTDWDRRKDLNNMYDPSDFPGNASKGTMSQFGTRWSKAALVITVAKGGTIHFHLDGMGDVQAIVNKQGNYGYNVTSRELRYLKRHWARLGPNAILYNGFDGNGNPMKVRPPW